MTLELTPEQQTSATPSGGSRHLQLLGGGTREIQLNIIAQMILGLPRK